MNNWKIPLDEAFLRERIGNMSQLAGLKRYMLLDGKAVGIEAVDVRAGGLEFTVLPGRGMDIAWASYKGTPLSYISKTGIVSPAYYESGGMNWLRNFFAGLLTTCGLQNVGGPCDENLPVIGESHFGLHGRISNCASENVSLCDEWQDGKYVMSVSGRLREAVLHGESLTLSREITTVLGENRFCITDRVKNEGCVTQPLTLLYHFNIGYPILDAGSRLSAASHEVTAMSTFSEQNIRSYNRCADPTAGIEEQCYAHEFISSEDGSVSAALINDALELGVYLSYLKEQLACFTQWKMLKQSEYVMGLEPGNCLPQGRERLRENGALPLIEPGEVKEFRLVFGVLDGREQIENYDGGLPRIHS